jgi:hypothetical protein
MGEIGRVGGEVDARRPPLGNSGAEVDQGDVTERARSESSQFYWQASVPAVCSRMVDRAPVAICT